MLTFLKSSFQKIKKALHEFKGVNRRFEIKGVKDGVMVVDDYAHHPTEIEATLQAAKTGWKKRIIAIFQPHLYSRTKDFYPEFGRAFFNSDILIVTDIYPAREEPIAGVTGELVAEAAKSSGHKQVFYIPKPNEVVKFLKKFLKKEDLVITLGAGDIYKVGKELLNNI